MIVRELYKSCFTLRHVTDLFVTDTLSKSRKNDSPWGEEVEIQRSEQLFFLI